MDPDDTSASGRVEHGETLNRPFGGGLDAHE